MIRPKYSKYKIILSYFDNTNKYSEYDTKYEIENVEPIDILEVMIDNKESNDVIKKYLNNIDLSNDFKYVIAILIMDNRFTLSHYYLDYFHPSFVKIAIEHDSFDMVALFKSLYPKQYTEYEQTYIDSIVMSFRKSNSLWIAKIYILKSLIYSTNYLQMESVLSTMFQSLEKEDPVLNPLYYAPNMLLLTCEIVEVCHIIQGYYNSLEVYTTKIKDIVINIASKYIEAIEDEAEIHSLCFEKDYENRDSLELVSKYNIFQIMNNKNMEKIALELWESYYDIKGDIMTTSSILKILSYDSFNKPRNIMWDVLFLNWKHRKPSS